MAFRAPPPFCADTAYQKFSPLQGYIPANNFCSNLAVHQDTSEINANLNLADSSSHAANWQDSQCPAGSSLCSLMSDLQAADKMVARNVCRCIGVYVVVPGNPMSEQFATKTTIRPLISQTDGPMTTPSSREDACVLVTTSLLVTTSSTESGRATPIATKAITIADQGTTFLCPTSLPSSFTTILDTSSAFLTAYCGTSSSILSSTSNKSSSISTKLSSFGTMDSVSSSSSSSVLPSSTSNSPSTPPPPTSTSTSATISPSASRSFPTCSPRSSTPSSSSSTTCTYPTARTPCPTAVTAAGLAYKQYHTGRHHVENAANPGAGGEPAIYTRFRGVYDLCAITRYCAQAAGAAYGPYHSFDLHYTCSNASWVCVQFFKGNRDRGFFDVWDGDVAVAVGYSY